MSNFSVAASDLAQGRPHVELVHNQAGTMVLAQGCPGKSVPTLPPAHRLDNEDMGDKALGYNVGPPKEYPQAIKRTGNSILSMLCREPETEPYYPRFTAYVLITTLLPPLIAAVWILVCIYAPNAKTAQRVLLILSLMSACPFVSFVLAFASFPLPIIADFHETQHHGGDCPQNCMSSNIYWAWFWFSMLWSVAVIMWVGASVPPPAMPPVAHIAFCMFTLLCAVIMAVISYPSGLLHVVGGALDRWLSTWDVISV